MTRVFIDDREIEPPNDVSSMGRIIKYVDEAHLAENAAVRQIRVNGQPLRLNDLPGAGEHATTGAGETPDKVEIYTGDIAEIARGSISEALRYLDRIESLTPSLAKSCRVNPSLDAIENLRRLYEGFYWLDLLIDRLKTDFPVHLGEALIRSSSKPEYRQKLIATLKRLRQSQETGDLIQVSALLEGEILPLVPLWREMFTAVAQKVGGMR